MEKRHRIANKIDAARPKILHEQSSSLEMVECFRLAPLPRQLCACHPPQRKCTGGAITHSQIDKIVDLRGGYAGWCRKCVLKGKLTPRLASWGIIGDGLTHRIAQKE